MQGLKNKFEPKIKVNYAEGSDLAEGIHNLKPIPSCYLETEDGKQGIIGEYFANDSLGGKPVFTRIDNNINFYWDSGSPSPDLPVDAFSIRWTGYLVPPNSGTYQIASWGMPELKIFIDGEVVNSVNNIHHAFHQEKAVELEAGKKYKLVYEYNNWHGDGDVKLLWSVPKPNMLLEAVELAQNSDIVVLVLGLSQRLEGEEMPIEVDGFAGGDRTHLKLPNTQRELMEKIKATGTPVVLVLMNGSALAINWANENIDAIISAGYPGQEGGNAVADVLVGDVNPAGRLPVTYYKSVNQLPAFENYDMAERTYKYFTGEPLYPFGFGLSYTTFEYSDIKLPETSIVGEPVTIKVNVKNSGQKDGDEVVQLYLTDEKASTVRPIRQLEGFKRIFLKSGEVKEVEFKLNARQFSNINKKGDRVIEPGLFKVSVGGKQPGFKGSADAFTSGVILAEIKLKGKQIVIE